jgi:hypothetical protein
MSPKPSSLAEEAQRSPAAVRAAEIKFYRAIIASCLANGLSWSNFTQALRDLGTAAVDERAHETTAGEAPVLLGRPIAIVSPFLKIGLDSFRRTRVSGAPPFVDDGVVVTGPRDDARMELCGAGFAFSRSGDFCLFGGFRRNQSRVSGHCGGSVAA